MSWQEDLWSELDAMDNIEQIKAASAWIEYITHTLSPELAKRRRFKVDEVLQQADMDVTRLAETIGTNRNTISRLRDEARAHQRELNRRAA